MKEVYTEEDVKKEFELNHKEEAQLMRDTRPVKMEWRIKAMLVWKGYKDAFKELGLLK